MVAQRAAITRRRFLQLQAGASTVLLGRCAPRPGPTRVPSPCPEPRRNTVAPIVPDETPVQPVSCRLTTEEGGWLPLLSHAR